VRSRALGVLRRALCAALPLASACDLPHGVAPSDGVDSPAPASSSSSVAYVAEIPVGLWRAPRDVRATPGNYVYVDSAALTTRLYTDDMSLTRVTRNMGTVTVSVSGADPRIGVFVGAQGMRNLAPGFYDGTTGLPFRNPTAYGLFIRLSGCAAPRGWFAVDSVRYQLDAITALDLRFEERCDDSGVAQHGQVRWRG